MNPNNLNKKLDLIDYSLMVARDVNRKKELQRELEELDKKIIINTQQMFEKYYELKLLQDNHSPLCKSFHETINLLTHESSKKNPQL